MLLAATMRLARCGLWLSFLFPARLGTTLRRVMLCEAG